MGSYLQQFRWRKEVLSQSCILGGNFTLVSNFEDSLPGVRLLDLAGLGLIQVIGQLGVVVDYVRLGHHAEFYGGLSFQKLILLADNAVITILFTLVLHQESLD